MLARNIKFKSLSSILGTAIAIGSVIGAVVPVNAQPNNNRERNNRESATITNNGLPSHRRDGGTRSSCVVDSREFVALVPNTAVSLTASSNPKLYFHVPQTSQSQIIEFVLRDRQDRLVYETFIETKGQSGIMSVEIPLFTNERSKSLDSITDYHWYLSYICNSEQRSQDLVLEGWIDLVELPKTTKDKLKTLTLTEQANFYRQQGIWHDALATAAHQLQTQSENNFQLQWSEFLNEIGLDEFVTKPLIERNEAEEVIGNEFFNNN